MKIKDILESSDGPKQGTSILKTMDRDTFDLLKDLNQWNKEREQAKRDKINAKSRKYQANKRKKNIFIWVGHWPVDVQVLEEWLETKDDNIPLNYAKNHGWGLPKKNDPTYQSIIEDPEYANLILDIWRAALNKYRHGDSPKNTELSHSQIEYKLSILGRKYRIAMHVDRKGLKLSPHIRHPELRLPQAYTLGAELRAKSRT